jgi:cellulose synthase/poly-beta-1,6-N-acetylglucosamine synthase-like glycosyltransferase
MLGTFLISIYFAASLALFVYSVNCYVLLILFLRKRDQMKAGTAIIAAAKVHFDQPKNLPLVTTQIPIYNEANVAERALRAVAAIDYPASLHEIQVLDDSSDETREIVDRTASELREAGHRIVVLRRADRSGFKAGALALGLEEAAGEYIAIFDADFVPPAHFLRHTLPFFLADPRLGIVQARWGHINDEDSLLTRAQAIGIDGHFMVEQAARTFNGLLMNFNGTAGVWRRQAIIEAGGWSGDTLTEDLDLSYRAQLASWGTHYIADLEAPAELPTTVTAFKSQQFRWAKGSIQTARKLLPTVWRRGDFSWWVKLQATLHLTHYAIHPLMLLVALLAAPVMWMLPSLSPVLRVGLTASVLVSLMAPNSLYFASQRALYPKDWWRRVRWFPALMCIGVGLALSNTRAVFEALIGRESDFVRTPKRGDRIDHKQYRVQTPILPWLELVVGVYCAASLGVYLTLGKYMLGPFLFIYSAGFIVIGIRGLWEQTTARERVVSAPSLTETETPDLAFPEAASESRPREAA